VQPSADFIDSGQTTTFQVQFAPEDVDNISAVLLCDIPHMARHGTVNNSDFRAVEETTVSLQRGNK
jgi:hypothetical protein